MYNPNLEEMPENQEVIVAYTFKKASNRVFYTIMRKFQNSYLFQDDKEPDEKSGFRLLGFTEIPKFNYKSFLTIT